MELPPLIRQDTERPAPRRNRHVAVAAAFVLTAIVLAALVLLRGPDPEMTAIRRLPDAERRALYERTLRTLTSSCAPALRTDGLDEFCRNQAAFVSKFPECDAACKSLAGGFERRPAR